MVSSADRGGFIVSPKKLILGFPINIINLEETLQLLESVLPFQSSKASKGRIRVITLNPEMMMMGLNDPHLLKALLSGDLIVPDGIGIVWALHLFGVKGQERVTGVDLVEGLLTKRQNSGLNIYLLGGEPGIAEAATTKIAHQWPGIKVAGFTHGYFPPDKNQKIIHDINQAQPDLLLVGMGVPRQELWLANNWEALKVPIGIGVGGLLDLWAGKNRRAPEGIRKIGLEWAYRAFKEPERLWRLRVLPNYIRIVCKERFGRRKLGEGNSDESL